MDRRADLYSVGMILYKTLTGAVPFEADDYNNLIIAITTEDPIHVAKHGVPIPEGLDDIVMKAISRDPGARFPDAASFTEALLPFRSVALDSLSASSSFSLPSPGGSVRDPGAPSPGRAFTPTGPSGARSASRDSPTLEGDSLPSLATGPVEAVESKSSLPSIPPVAAPPARGWGRWPVIGVLAFFLLATVGLVAALAMKASRLEREMRALARPSVVRAPAEPAVAEPAATAERSHRLAIEGLPEGAEVLVDGILHPERPLVLTEAPGSRHVEIRASGFETWEGDVAVHADASLPVVMVQSEKVGKGGPGKEGQPPAAGGSTGKKSKKKIDVDYPGT